MKVLILLLGTLFFIDNISSFQVGFPPRYQVPMSVPLAVPTPVRSVSDAHASACTITLTTGRQVSLKSFTQAMELLYHAQPFERECLYSRLVEGSAPCFPHNEFYKVVMEAINEDRDICRVIKASLRKKRDVFVPRENIGTSISVGGIIGSVHVVDPTGKWRD